MTPRPGAGRLQAFLPRLAQAALAAGLAAGLALAAPRPCPAADEDHGHAAMDMAAKPADSPKPVVAGVGVDERLGSFIPGDIVLRDENGQSVNLKDLITLPTLLVPVYYTCPNDCNLLLGSLSQILPQVALTPGRDFQVLTVSFDASDTPEIALRRKNDFATALSARFPMQYWKFLSGDEAAIRTFTEAIGFHFVRDGKTFLHPVILVSVSPSGKIARYLYGPAPLPFDLTMAATEAAGETVGLSIKRAVAFCYSYDPAGRRYVFDLMKIAGISVLAGLGIFLLFVVFGGKKRTTGQPRP
jgi:protein SCO1/2